MAVTRIKNNQITDSTILANAKVVNYSVTSTLLANNLVYGSDLTISGNLTVNGNTTTIDTTITTIEDPVILLASGQTAGTPVVDIGFVGARGNASNIAFVWDESATEFVTAFTSTGETNTTISITSYANFHTNDANISGNLTVGGNIDITGNVSNLVVTGNITGGNLLTAGIVSSGGNVTGGNLLTAGEVSATSNVTGGNINTAGLASVGGNVIGGNLTTSGVVTATGNVDGGNINTAGQVSSGGNVTGGNILTGGLISATSTITSASNITGGNLLTAGLISSTGTITSAANITGANILTAGVVSATGDVTGGNLVTGGTVSATGNVDGGNINTAGQVSATANITGGNVLTSGLISSTGNLTSGNINSAGTIDSTGNIFSGANIIATENLIGGNVQTSGTVSATGNITGGNIDTAGLITATGNISSGANIVATANVIGGNLTTSGIVTATGNISGGNLTTAGQVSSTGNVTGGNIATAGLITATGNVTGGNLLTAGLISTSSNIVGANITATEAFFGNVDLTGNLVVDSLTANTTISAGGNITGGNLLTGGDISSTGNLTANNVNTDTVYSSAGLTLTAASGDIVLNPSGNINVDGSYINNLADPVLAQDAATKEYVDNAVSSGIHIHQPVYVETPVALPSATYAQGGNTFTVNQTIAGNTVVFSTAANLQVNDQLWFSNSFEGIVANTAYFVVSAPNTSAAVLSTSYNGAPVSNITSNTGLTQSVRVNSGIGATLTATANGNLTIDGVAVSTTQRVLVYNQANAFENGVYVVSDAGNVSAPWILTRASDAETYIPDSSVGIDEGSYFYVQAGDTGAGESYVMTSPVGPFIIGYDALTFTQFSASQVYTANTNAGLSLTGTVFSAKVDNNTTAFDGGGNIIVKAGANLTTPNIGAATGTSLSLTGNATSGNVLTSGVISTSGNITATGNVTAAYFIGEGSQLANISKIYNGNSYANIASSGGNLEIQIAGGNTWTFTNTGDIEFPNGGAIKSTLSGGANTGISITTVNGQISSMAHDANNYVFLNDAGVFLQAGAANNRVSLANTLFSVGPTTTVDMEVSGYLAVNEFISANGNIIGANVDSSGTVSAVGNIIGGNVSTAGLITATGNITGGNLLTAGLISSTGNLTSGNISTAGNINGSNIIASNGFFGNINLSNDLVANSITSNTYVSATGNVIGGNVSTAGLITATGNITGGNFDTAGLITATGNITGGNITTAGLLDAGTANVTNTATVGNLDTGGTVSATGNITGGNVNTAGLITATGNITGGNIITSNLVQGQTVSATGNVIGGNVTTGGLIDAVGNITGGNVIGNTSGTFGNITISASQLDSNASEIRINGNGNDVNFAVQGDTVGNVFYIDAGTGTASFGSSSQTVNAVVAFNATNSVLMPVGNTGQRPSTGVTGMLRFNTTDNNLEIFNNSAWEAVGVPAFTVIADDQFNGDGSTVAFTLSSAQTTNSCIVSINGVVQIPTIAYSVSGTTLTFTEAPLSGDVIDVRQITTTTSVTSISNGSGNAEIGTSDTSATVNVTGNLIPTLGNTYNLGNATNSWQSLYVAGNTIYLGTLQLKQQNATTFAVFQADGITQADIDVGNIDVSSLNSGNSTIGIYGTGQGYITVNGNANVLLASNTGVAITGTVSATGNITGNYLFGNGSQLTGIDATSIQNGTANVRTFNNGNVTTSAAGTANVVVVTSTGTIVTGTESVTGNVIAGNVNTAGLVTATGNIIGGNIRTAGQVSATGNITGGNILINGDAVITGNLSVSGTETIFNVANLTVNDLDIIVANNVTGGANVNGAGIQAGNPAVATWFFNNATTSWQSNIGITPTANGTLSLGGASNYWGTAFVSTASVTGNVQAGNIRTTGVVSATGNITGNYLFGNGSQLTGIDATSIQNGTANVRTFNNGNVTTSAAGTANVVVVTSTGTITSGTASVTGTITGGNVATAGTVSATGTITGGNVATAGTVSATGNITGGNLSVGTGTISVGNIVNTNGNGVGNIGSSSLYFNTVFAKATSAQYADLAEKYTADADYEPGTVVMFGGAEEVTACNTDGCRRVAGVISTNPSYIMNGTLESAHVATVALTGRVPCKVTGTVRKGDLMVSAGNGRARAEADPKVGTVIGKALADHDGAEGIIEVVVGRF